MSHLTVQQRSLVAIGASLASNCIPCTKFHIQKGLRAGLTKAMIGEAAEIADSVRQVPARDVRETAAAALRTGDEEASRSERKGSCGGAADASVSAESAGSSCCGPKTEP